MAIRSPTFKESYYEDIKLFQTIWIKFWVAVLVLGLVLLPIIGDPYFVYLVNLSCIATVAALGLNILTGFTGQVSLGHAAFLAIGAYGSSIMALRFNTPFWVNLLFGGGAAAVAGAIVGIPCLRLKGLYLAMATMAFGVVVEYLVITWDGLTGGVRGMNMPKLAFAGYSLDTDEKMYVFLLVITGLMLAAAKNITRTRVGRAFVAIRDRDIAAETIGVNITYYKVLSFAISSFYAGVAGGMYSYTIGYIHPEHFTLLLSIQYIAMIIVGGMGSIVGTVFGAVFIVVIPEFIKLFAQGSAKLFPFMKDRYDEEWNIAFFGLLIMIFLIFEPGGLYSIWTRIKVSFKNWPFTY